MRLALVILVVPAVAAADPVVDDLAPLPPRTVKLGVAIHTSKLSGLNESGTGPTLELAVTRARWQLFVEGSHAWVTVGPEGSVVEGKQLRGGIGARWLARSFELGDAGAFDLMFEAFAGVHRFAWDGDVAGPIVRPDIGLGVGFADRLFIRGHQLAFHMMARVSFARVERDDVTAVCRGTCMMPASSSNSGITVVAGLSWW